MSNDKILSVITELTQIGSDLSVPKNVRTHVKRAIYALEDQNGKVEVKIDKALEELGDADTDPNIPQYTRTKIWGVVSALESNNLNPKN